MNKLILICCNALLFASCTTPHHSGEQLISMELGRSRAIEYHDSVALENMYSDDFSGVAAGGVIVNKQLMNLFKKHDNELIFINGDHLVRFVDDRTAVLTGKLTAKDKSNNIVSVSRFSHVLSFRDGRWQIVYGQGTVMPVQENKE